MSLYEWARVMAKWFHQLNPEMAAGAAARIVLRSRIAAVNHYLDRLAETAHDPEDVHQLRVSTRRLSAALAIFRSLLDQARHRAVRRACRRLRRAAGASRDLEVKRARLGTRRPEQSDGTAGMRRLEPVFRAEQRQANRDFRRALRKWRERFRQSSAELLVILAQDSDRTASARAPLRRLARMRLREYLAGIRAAARYDPDDLDQMHQLRIKAKRLRYALEVFSGCFDRREIMPLYRDLVRIQDDLGQLNDLRILRHSLRGWTDHVERRRSGRAHGGRVLDPLIERVDGDLRQQHGDVQEQWSADRMAEFCREAKRKLDRLAAPKNTH